MKGKAVNLVTLVAAVLSLVQSGPMQDPQFLRGGFHWMYGVPVLEARAVEGVEFVSVKDPSIVREGDKWHLFYTVRGPKRTHAIVYSSFGEFSEANLAPRRILPCHPGYFCAPQVFYFTPHRKWYLVYQLAEKSRTPPFGPCFSTTRLTLPSSSIRPTLFCSRPAVSVTFPLIS